MVTKYEIKGGKENGISSNPFLYFLLFLLSGVMDDVCFVTSMSSVDFSTPFKKRKNQSASAADKWLKFMRVYLVKLSACGSRCCDVLLHCISIVKCLHSLEAKLLHGRLCGVKLCTLRVSKPLTWDLTTSSQIISCILPQVNSGPGFLRLNFLFPAS